MIIDMRVRGRAVVAAVALFAVCSVCAVVASGAVAGEPTGEFAIFKQCPLLANGVNLCIYAQTLSGEVTIGRLVLPLERPLLLQGGIALNEETFAETFFGALNGETLSRAPQKVPGGLFGRSLYATLELTSGSEIEISTSNLQNRTGTAVLLPVRMRLESPLLGSECYIGSRGNPIVLHLMTGKTSPDLPNRPISGNVGRIHLRDEYNLEEVTGDVMVDNTFSMPGASGCGGPGDSALVDAMIDQDLYLPSPDGHNAIVEDNTLWEGTTEGVTASEGG